MKTLKTNPDLMTVICNIQAMNEKIDPSYNGCNDFKRLEKLTENELYNMQDELIPAYNNAVKK